MKFNRPAAALLSAAILSSALFACGESARPSSPSETKQNSGGDVSAETSVTESPYLASLPADTDLGGIEVRVTGYVDEASNGNELSVDELNGEVINDAVFTRNLNVEQRLNVKIKPNVTPDWTKAGEIKTVIQSGSDEFDVYFARSSVCFDLSLNGMLLDVYKVDGIDSAKPYWSQGFIEAASINNRLYVLTGPMSLGFYRYMMIEVFNKDMFKRTGIDMPYQAVLDGKWTLDYQNSLASSFYIDINGDGNKDESDQYGFVTRMMNDTSINDGYWSSLNIRTLAKDEDGYYIPAIDAGHISEAFDHLLALMKGDGTAGMCTFDDDIYRRFNNGLAAMSNARLYVVEGGDFRGMEDDYGILPMPKATEAQDSYYTLAQDQFICYGLPITIAEDRADSIGIFLEAFASESYATVKPAYYEVALTEKYMNDEESKQMLNLVIDSLYIDPSIYFGTPINIYLLRNMLVKGENNAASEIAKNENAMATFVDKLNAAYGK